MVEFLWVEKYRPRIVDDIVLPPSIKNQLKTFVKVGNVPNLLLSGGPGVGKTTAAKAVLEELGCEYIVINGSMDGNIQTLRDDIRSFATSVSFEGGRKYVILDEADYLNPNSTQPALRNFMEEYSVNCGFIFTCNFPNKIIEPLHSRLTQIDFKITKAESVKLATDFMSRAKYILDEEGIQYDTKVLVELIKMHFPDWRKILNELQGYGMVGKIDSGILSANADGEIVELVSLLKERNFKEMRRWVAQTNIDFQVLCRKIYDKMYDIMTKESIPQAVITIADYQYKAAFAKDPEINTVAMLTELMSEVNFL